ALQARPGGSEEKQCRLGIRSAELLDGPVGHRVDEDPEQRSALEDGADPRVVDRRNEQTAARGPEHARRLYEDRLMHRCRKGGGALEDTHHRERAPQTRREMLRPARLIRTAPAEFDARRLGAEAPRVTADAHAAIRDRS